MGNREDLLAAAKRCLYEKGYDRTTARDVATAAGTSLAAIGYHYGSTESLMNAAVMEAIREWGREVGRAMEASLDPEAGLMERFEWYWSRMADSFQTQRKLWAASVGVLTQADRVPEVREALAHGLHEGRKAWASLLQGLDPEAEPRKAWAVGSVYQALLSGILMQWLVDPERAPTGPELADALRLIAAAVYSGLSGQTGVRG